MKYAALICHVDASREQDRKRLRAEHLAYIVQHRDQILFGGPTLAESGSPETMLLIIHANSLDEAHCFIAAEPYSANGVFSQVDVREWARVLPEAHDGDLTQALALERAGHV